MYQLRNCLQLFNKCASVVTGHTLPLSYKGQVIAHRAFGGNTVNVGVSTVKKSSKSLSFLLNIA